MIFFKNLINRLLNYHAERLRKEYDRKIGGKPTIYNKEVERQTGITGVLYVERIERIMFWSNKKAIELFQLEHV